MVRPLHRFLPHWDCPPSAPARRPNEASGVPCPGVLAQRSASRVPGRVRCRSENHAAVEVRDRDDASAPTRTTVARAGRLDETAARCRVPVITECDDHATATTARITRCRMGSRGAAHKRRARLRELAEPNLEGCAAVVAAELRRCAGRQGQDQGSRPLDRYVRRLKLPAAGLGCVSWPGAWSSWRSPLQLLAKPDSCQLAAASWEVQVTAYIN